MDKKFISGLYLDEKVFDNGSIIKVSVNEKFIEYYNANKNERGYVNIDLKRGKVSQKLYAELNTYKPKESTNANNAQVEDDDFDDSIPF